MLLIHNKYKSLLFLPEFLTSHQTTRPKVGSRTYDGTGRVKIQVKLLGQEI